MLGALGGKTFGDDKRGDDESNNYDKVKQKSDGRRCFSAVYQIGPLVRVYIDKVWASDEGDDNPSHEHINRSKQELSSQRLPPSFL